MVKYLSDNRTDQRFQTILSRSQPFQGEVAEQRFPVTEVDLSASLNMIGNLGKAYTNQQSEELQRERMGIEYETSLANQQAAKARQAKDDSEKRLINTMKNEYALQLSDTLDQMAQDPNMTYADLEVAVRKIRNRMIKNVGGYVNADELIKVENGVGVNVTNDLIKADIDYNNEERKWQRNNHREAVLAFNVQTMGEIAKTLPYPVLEQRYNKSQNALAGFSNALAGDARYALNTDDPAVLDSNKQYISPDTKRNGIQYMTGIFRDSLAQRVANGQWVTPEASAKDFTVAQDYLMNQFGLSGSDAEYIIKYAMADAGYTGNKNYMTDMLKAEAEAIKNKETLWGASAARSEAFLNKMNNDVLVQMSETDPLLPIAFKNPEVINAMQGTPGGAAILERLAASLGMFAQNYGGATANNYGKAFSTAINDAIQFGDMDQQKAARNTAEILLNTGVHEGSDTIFTHFDKEAQLYALNNVLTQLRDSDTQRPYDEDTVNRLVNGVDSLNKYRALMDSSDYNKIPVERQNELARDIYAPTRRKIGVTVGNGLQMKELGSHVRFDKASNKLVLVDVKDYELFNPAQSTFTGDYTSAREKMTDMLETYTRLDMMNQLFNDGKFSVINGQETADDFRDSFLSSYNIKEKTPDEKIYAKPLWTQYGQGGDLEPSLKNLIGLGAEAVKGAYELGTQTTAALSEAATTAFLNRTGNKQEDSNRILQDKYSGSIDIRDIPNGVIEAFVVKDEDGYKVVSRNVKGKRVSKDEAIAYAGSDEGIDFGSYKTKEDADEVVGALDMLGQFNKEQFDKAKKAYKEQTGVTYTGNIIPTRDHIAKRIRPEGYTEYDFQDFKSGDNYYLESIDGGTVKDAKEYFNDTGKYLAKEPTKEKIEKQKEALSKIDFRTESQESNKGKTLDEVFGSIGDISEFEKDIGNVAGALGASSGSYEGGNEIPAMRTTPEYFEEAQKKTSLTE